MLDYDISTPAAVAQNTANGSHSAVIGVSMDGYPIYGLWGYDGLMNVVEMKSSYKLKEGETGYNGIDDYVYVKDSDILMYAMVTSGQRQNSLMASITIIQP